MYDPRRLTSPWDQTSCSGSHVIKDLHWQHTSSSKSSRTAAKASSQDSHAARRSAEQNDATTSAVSMQAHAASVFATPAPASPAAVSVSMLPFCMSCTAAHLLTLGQEGEGITGSRVLDQLSPEGFCSLLHAICPCLTSARSLAGTLVLRALTIHESIISALVCKLWLAAHTGCTN